MSIQNIILKLKVSDCMFPFIGQSVCLLVLQKSEKSSEFGFQTDQKYVAEILVDPKFLEKDGV